MNFLEKSDILSKVLGAIVVRRKYPLIVCWDITYKCNSQCRYCPYWKVKAKELDTKEVLTIIERFGSLGTKFIVFSGGEPLLRDDLPDIINSCKEKKIHVSINSNGTLIKQRIKKIRRVNAIKLSLDGPREINDSLRYKGAHDKVLEAIKICKSEGIAVNMTTIISKENLSHIPYVLDIAEKFNIGVFFQPIKQDRFNNENKNIISTIPDEGDYRKIILLLIEEKRKGNKFIKNSIGGLKHLYHWPKSKKIFCLMSLLSCCISPDGYICVCDWFLDCQKHLISTAENLKKLYYNLRLPHSCEYCWNASSVEFNLLGQLELGSILGMWRRLRDR